MRSAREITKARRHREAVGNAFDVERPGRSAHLEIEQRGIAHVLGRAVDDPARHAFDDPSLVVDGLDADPLGRFAAHGGATPQEQGGCDND
jgi:hypothetical protein